MPAPLGLLMFSLSWEFGSSGTLHPRNFSSTLCSEQDFLSVKFNCAARFSPGAIKPQNVEAGGDAGHKLHMAQLDPALALENPLVWGHQALLG